MLGPSKQLYADRHCRCDEYDWRDDNFIQEILKYMNIQTTQKQTTTFS